MSDRLLELACIGLSELEYACNRGNGSTNPNMVNNVNKVTPSHFKWMKGSLSEFKQVWDNRSHSSEIQTVPGQVSQMQCVCVCVCVCVLCVSMACKCFPPSPSELKVSCRTVRYKGCKWGKASSNESTWLWKWFQRHCVFANTNIASYVFVCILLSGFWPDLVPFVIFVVCRSMFNISYLLAIFGIFDAWKL